MTKNGIELRPRVGNHQRHRHKILRCAVHMVVEDRIHILPLSIRDLCGYGESACYEEQESEEEYVEVSGQDINLSFKSFTYSKVNYSVFEICFSIKAKFYSVIYFKH